MVPGGCGPSEGSLNEREEEEKEKEEREGGTIEGVESDTACSLWEQKTKTKVREKRYWSEWTDRRLSDVKLVL